MQHITEEIRGRAFKTYSNAKIAYRTKDGKQAGAIPFMELLPLSKITDEDADEVAMMVGLHSAGNTIVREEGRVVINNDTYQMAIGYNGYCCLRKNKQLYNQNMIPIIDYLRLKYDLGYDRIGSLIEAGLAIDPTVVDIDYEAEVKRVFPKAKIVRHYDWNTVYSETNCGNILSDECLSSTEAWKSAYDKMTNK